MKDLKKSKSAIFEYNFFDFNMPIPKKMNKTFTEKLSTQFSASNINR